MKIHKAARIENIQERITLIQNKHSNKRNLGSEASILNISFFNDLADYLAMKNKTKNYHKAIIKINRVINICTNNIDL